jgi:hypothetical protein
MIRAAGILLLATAAVAAEPMDVRVALPQSAVAESSAEPAPASPTRLDFRAMAWSPRSFTLPARVESATAFQSAGTPSLSFAAVLPSFGRRSALPVSWRLGAGVTYLQRTGSFTTDGLGRSSKQSFYWVPVIIGLEAAPRALAVGHFGLRGGVAALPSAGFTQRSALDGGTTVWGLPFEGSAAAYSDLGWIDAGWRQFEIAFEANYVTGRLGSSSLRGGSVGAGFRVAL